MAGFSRLSGAGRHRLLAGLAALCLLLAAPAVAQTAKGEFPAGELEFVVPAKWNVEGGRQKVILVSPGEDAFVEFTLLQPGSENALKAQLGRRLSSTLTDTVLSDDGQSLKINGMPAVKVSGIGSSDATAVRFVALALAPTAKQPVMVLAYTAQDGFPDLQPVFETLFASLNRR
ncbi:MAG: hypothetical protein AB7F36_05735 [Reyranellaceae bacterium]